MSSETTDLVTFLRARFDETERIARAAAHLSGGLSGGAPAVGERWRVSGSHADDGGTYWSVTTASPDLDRVPVTEMVGSGMSGGGAHTEEVAAHIAAHDPARVLTEISGKRRTLARMAEVLELGWDYYENSTVIDLARDTLLDLASAYGSHPDYRDEWRSEGPTA